ncbi:MAG: hypothetical protein ACFFCW_48070, partial [Candidatus Hodarchaeota archaeon]
HGLHRDGGIASDRNPADGNLPCSPSFHIIVQGLFGPAHCVVLDPFMVANHRVSHIVMEYHGPIADFVNHLLTQEV